MAIRDVVGSRLSELEAQFTGIISDIVGFGMVSLKVNSQWP